MILELETRLCSKCLFYDLDLDSCIFDNCQRNNNSVLIINIDGDLPF